VQHAFDNLPRISHGVAPPGRVSVVFRTRSGPSLLWSGLEIEPTSLVVQGPWTDYYIRSSGGASLGAISLPMDLLASMGVALAGRDLFLPRNGLMLVSRPMSFAKLRRLHTAAGHLAIASPATLADPEAARCLEQSLIEAMIDSLRTGELREDKAAERRHQVIMRRFYAVLEANPERSLYLPELCAAIGVTERTLRRRCQEQFGVSPKRFLLRRRMHLARHALRNSDTTATTVASVAAGFGFWDFGRFASAYKSLFGESPSLTLRQSA
jgi:AraC-like DNA-binding protein